MMSRVLSKIFAFFLAVTVASQASAMFIQPDWLDPTQPGVGTNRYAYSGNNPVNNRDTNGNWYDGYYGVYPTVPYNTDPNFNSVARALDNTGRYVLNTPTSMLNIFADGFYGLGNLAAPYAGTVENMAMTTPTAADDLVAAGFQGWTRLSLSVSARAAAPIDGFNIAYQQSRYSERFSVAGAKIYTEISGVPINTIDDLAGAIQQGQIAASDVAVNYVVREGSRVVANTRTSVALQRAGVDPADWNWVDRTGVSRWEKRVDDALKRSKLDDPVDELEDN